MLDLHSEMVVFKMKVRKGIINESQMLLCLGSLVSDIIEERQYLLSKKMEIESIILSLTNCENDEACGIISDDKWVD